MQLRDDLLSLLVAGHETTGSVLTWTLYLLSKVLCYFSSLFFPLKDNVFHFPQLHQFALSLSVAQC